MAKTDIKALLKELNGEIEQFAVVSDKWVDFLKSAAWNYKYSFVNQLLIYSQRPDARACADFNVWNSRLHRYVVKGATGIALLNDTGDKVSYVFDVSDTRSNTGEDLKLWKLGEENNAGVLQALNEDHGYNCEAVDGVVVRQVEAFLEASGELYLPAGDIREDADFVGAFNEYVKYSAVVMSLIRCGFEEAAEDYARRYLVNVGERFDSNAKLIALGTATAAIAEAVLREIEHNVRVIDKYNLSLTEENKEDVSDGHDIQEGGRISDTGDRKEGSVDREDRKDGDVEAAISTSEQPDNVLDAVDDRGVGAASDRDIEGGEFTDRAIDAEPVESQSGTFEGDERNGLGATHERDSLDGGRDGEEGIDIP